MHKFMMNRHSDANNINCKTKNNNNKNNNNNNINHKSIAVPVVRSVIFKDSEGRNVSSTTTEWVSINNGSIKRINNDGETDVLINNQNICNDNNIICNGQNHFTQLNSNKVIQQNGNLKSNGSVKQNGHVGNGHITFLNNNNAINSSNIKYPIYECSSNSSSNSNITSSSVTSNNTVRIKSVNINDSNVDSCNNNNNPFKPSHSSNSLKSILKKTASNSSSNTDPLPDIVERPYIVRRSSNTPQQQENKTLVRAKIINQQTIQKHMVVKPTTTASIRISNPSNKDSMTQPSYNSEANIFRGRMVRSQATDFNLYRQNLPSKPMLRQSLSSQPILQNNNTMTPIISNNLNTNNKSSHSQYDLQTDINSEGIGSDDPVQQIDEVRSKSCSSQDIDNTTIISDNEDNGIDNQVRGRSVTRNNIPRSPNRRSESMFSRTYTKIYTPDEMSAREAWAETQRKKAKMREEFFRVPYEECNKEIINGRRSRSEPRMRSYQAKDFCSEYKPSFDLHEYLNDKENDLNIVKLKPVSQNSPAIQNNNYGINNKNYGINNKNYYSRQGKHDQRHDIIRKQERKKKSLKFSPIKEVPDKMNKEINENSNESIRITSNRKQTPSPRISKSNKSFLKESPKKSNKKNDANFTSPKKTKLNSRHNSVDIYMQNRPSFTEQHIDFETEIQSSKPHITVKRYLIPNIPYREKWEWMNKYAPEALEPKTQAKPLTQSTSTPSNIYDAIESTENIKQRTKMPSLPLSTPKSPTSPLPLTTPSPTPSWAGSCCLSSSSSSSSSSGCYSGSCSPTPPPSRINNSTKAALPTVL